jgi:hypothetical protein
LASNSQPSTHNAFFFLSAAQTQMRLVDLRGEVRDQLGYVIVGARVSLVDSQNATREVTSDKQGRFHFKQVASGSYKLTAVANGFAAHEQELVLSADTASQHLTITLYPRIVEELTVKEEANSIALDPARAAGAQVLKDEQLKVLPDDPDQFKDFLQLLATSSGSAPGQATVTVDGHTHEGRLPPKSAIREVRVNSNIFSAEYDKPPYRGGRVDIYTKPGAAALHGSGFFHFNDSALNAREVFAPTKAPTSTRRYGGQLGGPIVPKRSGYYLDFEARDIHESATINAIILDGRFQPSALTASVPTPKRLIIGSARADWQMAPTHTLVFRYDLNHERLSHQGAGGFDLLDRAYGSRMVSHSFRFSETGTIGRLFTEARVGVTRLQVTQRSTSNAPAITVPGAFTSGGASAQSLNQEETRLELTDHLSIVTGPHSLKLGAQIVGKHVEDARSENFNGTFVFGGGLAPQLDSEGNVVIGPDGPVLQNISGLEQYRRTLLGLPGGAPARFSITRGDPLVLLDHWTLAGFAQNEWRVGSNVMVSLGLRCEGQTTPADKLSLAPRLGIAYSPDRKHRLVVRARAGIFYDRISETLTGEARRLDGRRLQQIIIDAPAFPDPFRGGATVDVIPTVRRLEPALHPPTSFQTQAAFEYQLPRGWKIDVSHYWARGIGLLRTRNINAPMVAEDSDPLAAPRPFGVRENILQFESSGSLSGQVLFVGLNQTGNKRLLLFSGYLWFDFHTDADQPFLQPQSSYDLRSEWARPFWHARHRAFLGGMLRLPWKLQVSPTLNLASGQPFNITTGRDNNGDGNFNDRPDIVEAGHPKAILTAFGALDPTAVNGTLGRNVGTQPLTAFFDLDVSRTFEIGKRSADHPYQLTVNARTSNLPNRANLMGTSGVLASPFFGRANRAAPARQIEIGLRFSF